MIMTMHVNIYIYICKMTVDIIIIIAVTRRDKGEHLKIQRVDTCESL